MKCFFRLTCLMVTLAVAPSTTFPARPARAAAPSPDCSERSGFPLGACTSNQAGHTLAFYIPRPLRGPQAQAGQALAFYIPRPLRGPQV